jgi:hypothetical protein
MCGYIYVLPAIKIFGCMYLIVYYLSSPNGKLNIYSSLFLIPMWYGETE